MSTVRAVVLRSGGVLLVRRGCGPWEFPLADALRAELGIEAAAGDEIAPGARLFPRFSGELKPAAGLELKWVTAQRLPECDLAPADRAVADAVAAHRRRKRYKGTHPRAFEEKYKELGADPEAMAKAKARGSTPAGAHLSIMVPEVLEALAPLTGAAILDCTLGWGGHAEALARRAAAVIGLDRDGEELARARARLHGLGLEITTRQCDYADARRTLDEMGLAGVDALFADLGVSSMQIDRPERGMSFKTNGPLDMRMDRSKGGTAAEWLEKTSEAEIADALARYGDEPDASKIAAAITALAALGRTPKTTAELAAVVGLAKGLGAQRIVKKSAFSAHPATRTFQALRIAVNSERESLSRLLRDLPALVRPGGRAVLLTFHSGEEALVRSALTEQTSAGLWLGPPAEPRKPSPEEVHENPRSRSARLWRAVRT